MAYSSYTGGTPSRQDPTNFSDYMDAWIAWFTPNADEVVTASDAAVAAADAAEAVAGGAELAVWVSGGSYSAGDARASTVDGQSYRALTTHSGETTDPSADATNWAPFTISRTPTLDSITLNGAAVETVYTVTGTTPDLDPANGTIQVWTLTANSTPTTSLATGESLVLMVDDGTGYALDLDTSVVDTWLNVSGLAPTLATSGYSSIILSNVGGTVFGYVAKEA